MHNPLISVIVPCYNQAQYLDECLQSVLDQTYPNWECIIVNDGSPDNTEEVAKKWLAKDSRFKYYYKKNGGLSSARNYGLDKSIGEFIQLLDCDDYLEKNKFKNQANQFNDSIDIYIAGYRYFEDSEGIKNKRILGRNNFLPEVCLLPDDKKDIKLLFKNKNPFVVSAPLFRKSVFDIVGVFNENLTSLEDWEFNFRCALHDMVFKHTGYNKEDKVLIRLHDNSMMRNQLNMEKNSATFKAVFRKNKMFIDHFGTTEYLSKNNFNYKEKIALFIPPIFFILKNKLNEKK